MDQLKGPIHLSGPVSGVLLDVFHQFFKDMTVHLLQIAYLHLPIHYFLFLLLRTNNITSIAHIYSSEYLSSEYLASYSSFARLWHSQAQLQGHLWGVNGKNSVFVLNQCGALLLCVKQVNQLTRFKHKVAYKCAWCQCPFRPKVDDWLYSSVIWGLVLWILG